jgi:hypothetical protein
MVFALARVICYMMIDGVEQRPFHVVFALCVDQSWSYVFLGSSCAVLDFYPALKDLDCAF